MSDLIDEGKCTSCGEHDINYEDGQETCDSCVMDNFY